MLTQSTQSPRRLAKKSSLQVVSDGTRFMKDGHWWEVDAHITGREGAYYRCHPVCNIETRFFRDYEINQALDDERKTLSINHNPGHSRETVRGEIGRGSGRIGQVIPMSHAKNRPHNSMAVLKSNASCKLLAIGSRTSIQQTIRDLHTLGFAHATDWSPVQRKPKSSEYMSIFTGRKS